jgi:hypothetical protein
LLGTTLLFVTLLTQVPNPQSACPPPGEADFSGAATFAVQDSLPFRFPLESSTLLDAGEPIRTPFVKYGRTTRGYEYHAAEDYPEVPGAPVYAMTDGRVSFSGRMGGYGWLVIVDHPEMNLYSLYGHLSPSRWKIEPGPVHKGDLLGHIGDSHENGGSRERPMFPHLHLGVRAGQRGEYPGKGEWRWMAGWIQPCPRDLGWLQPSTVIASQQVPVGGYPGPEGGFLAKWGVELLLGSIYGFCAACMLVFAVRRNRTPVLFVTAVAMGAIGWFLDIKGMRVSVLLFGISILFVIIGAFRLVCRPAVEHSDGQQDV